jgi:hypothetical protein
MPTEDPKAIRLTFSYQGDEAHLESAQLLDMTAPASAAVTGYDGDSGFWVQLEDDADQVLHRRVLQQPMKYTAEVFPEQQGDQFQRVAVTDPHGSFDVVVPDLPEARTVSLYASTPPRAPRGEPQDRANRRVAAGLADPAHEIARFPLPTNRGQS